MRLIDADALIEAIEADMKHIEYPLPRMFMEANISDIRHMPTIEERKTDIIQKFHDYQIEWLKSHYDIELEPQLEEMIVRFLHDTANCYMMEVEHGRPDQQMRAF